jgi:hypothetical protein
MLFQIYVLYKLQVLGHERRLAEADLEAELSLPLVEEAKERGDGDIGGDGSIEESEGSSRSGGYASSCSSESTVIRGSRSGRSASSRNSESAATSARRGSDPRGSTVVEKRKGSDPQTARRDGYLSQELLAGLDDERMSGLAQAGGIPTPIERELGE